MDDETLNSSKTTAAAPPDDPTPPAQAGTTEADDAGALTEPDASHRETVAAPTTDVGASPDDPNRTSDYSPNDLAPGDEGPWHLAPGRRIAGRYRVEAILGRGGFWVVYLAYDPDLRRRVAIKVTGPASERALGQFLEEGRKVAQLDHSCIVPVYDCGRLGGGAIYTVSKYIDRGHLGDRLAGGRLAVAEAVNVALRVAEALGHAHGRGIIHRDVKPKNILLDAQGGVYLADFGLALRAEDRSERPHIEGSPSYMSPEQADGRSRMVDQRTDIFSLGIILYEMLTGDRPFRGKTIDELLERLRHEDPIPPRQVAPEIPPELERVCLKALAKDPDRRHHSAEELARDLRDCAAAAARRRRGAAIACILLAALIALALALAVIARRDRPGRRTGPAASAPRTRELAEWILKRGGALDVVDRHPPTIRAVDKLPAGALAIRCIDLHEVKPIRPEELDQICALDGLLHLQLSDTDLSNGDLLAIGRLKGLKSLWINYNEVDDVGVAHLGELKALRRLNMGWTNVSDEGVRAISGAVGLNFLDLSNTSISDAAIKPLGGLTRLQVLLLNRTAITDACVDDLARLTGLVTLEVAETKLSPAAIGRLKAALPECRVVDRAE
jgi:hypothetical protein